MSPALTPATSGPQLGWVALSRRALAAAEKLVRDEEAGVRDEVGVLALHRGYSNRFFPGTSVQHSRIRYLLFVGWQLQAILADPQVRTGQDAREALEALELELAGRLHAEGLDGVIGGQTATNHQRLTSLPASAAYWSALGAWGVLRGGADGAPSRRDVFASWSAWAERPTVGESMTDDEAGLLRRRVALLHTLPKPPKNWPEATKTLSFKLRGKERGDLRSRLAATVREDGEPSLLARLASQQILPTGGARDAAWHADVRAVADASDRAALRRARDASSLAGILRGLYNACLETLREEVDGVADSQKHRNHLRTLVRKHQAAAERVDTEAFEHDGLSLGGLRAILDNTIEWLGSSPDDPLAAREWLAGWESQRKGDRARLPPTSPARDLRATWKAPTARPLGYRWWVVVSILDDLGGVRGDG